MTIHFRDIRTDHGGPRSGFEEMYCQIARRCPPPDQKEFRRVDGAGGDGGVEAYWIDSSGRKYGFQAKYFLATKDIDWRQLDKSVSQALDSHPELIEYTFGLACDLTDRAGAKSKGKRGFDHWDKHKEQWEAQAHAKGMCVTFKLQTASDLVDILSKPDYAGMRAYWFGGTAFTDDWFTRKLEEVCNNLDERYHPEDHVDVSTQDYLEAIRRSPGFMKSLRDRLSRMADTLSVPDFKDSEGAKPDPALVKDISHQISDLRSCIKLTNFNISDPLPTAVWEAKIQVLQEQFKCLDKWIYSDERVFKEESGYDSKWDFLSRNGTKLGALISFSRELDSTLLKAERTRALLISGEAGSGKSHLLAESADKAISDGGIAILLLGHNFHSHIESDILRLLDLGERNFEALLGALNCAAEARNTRCMIIIDAINETHDLKIWKNQLAGVATQILRYPCLSFCISLRPEYSKTLVPQSVKGMSTEIDHHGFNSLEEEENAARQYIEKRGIMRPTVPRLSPEFRNPLFLRTCCESMNRAGVTKFPRGLHGSSRILGFYLEKLGEILCMKFPHADLNAEDLSKAINQATKIMVAERRDYLTRKELRNTLKDVFGSTGPGPDHSWSHILCAEGLFRKDYLFSQTDVEQDILEEEVFRFSYQRFFDLLFVRQLMISEQDPNQLFAENGVCRFIINDLAWIGEWQRLFHALATLIPEKYKGYEFPDLLEEAMPEKQWWNRDAIQYAFIESLRYRKVVATTKETAVLFNKLNTGIFGINSRLMLFIEFAAIPKHRFNADALHSFLSSLSLADRDAIWSIEFADVGDDTDDSLSRAVNQLIDWSLHASKGNAETEVLRLSAICLSWLLTLSNRQIRDRATKALTALFRDCPSLIPDLIEKFHTTNDLYVLERLCAAVFGAATRWLSGDDLTQASTAIYKFIFKDKAPPKNLLLRDYALGVIEKANHDGCHLTSIDLERCRPPYKSEWVFEDIDEKALEEKVEKYEADAISRSASNFGDFGIYKIPPSIRCFLDTPFSQSLALEKNFDIDAARRWVINRAIEMGWSKERFPKESGYYMGRGRGVIERIGKKYQWLALSELLANLSDTYWLIESYHAGKAFKYQSLWDINFSRDIDPTVMPQRLGSKNKTLSNWWHPFEIEFHEIESIQRINWCFGKEDIATPENIIALCDNQEEEWLTLHTSGHFLEKPLSDDGNRILERHRILSGKYNID